MKKKNLMVILLNIFLLISAISLFISYANVYKERLREENLGNISNLNRAAAVSATALISNWDVKLDDIVQYVQANDCTYEETLQFIFHANSNERRQFEMIGEDFTGYCLRLDENNQFIPVSYAHSGYEELQKIFKSNEAQEKGVIYFAPEFTDNVTALKYFAIYSHLNLKNEAGERQNYTLLLAAESKDVLYSFNNQSGFEGQSNVLMNADGDYIVSNSDFKSNNFFQYLYVYNDLTLDEKKQIANEMQEQKEGVLYYQNAVGQKCVFCYSKVEEHDWYCVTCVPVSSFRTPSFSISYAVYAALLLVLLLLIDIFWLFGMNSRLRLSMQREKEAGEAKTDFLSRMSHDIRTPLNGIIGMTALAIEEPNPPRTVEYLDNIKVSGQFLLGLVNDILDMNKVESGKIELHPVPYSDMEFVSYVDAVVVPLCKEKGLEFVMTKPNGHNIVLLDPLRFNQVFFNLLSNGVKYTPEGGKLEIYWECNPLEENRIALDFLVRDNGIGMSQEFQKHMFESFAQEHTQYSNTGTGLGLPIVKSLIQLMGGQISVESELGKGTSIKVHLEAERSMEPVKNPALARMTDLKGKRVLLCEDNKTNVFFIQRLFEKWELQVDVAENGRIGVDKFEQSEPGTYQAILMDIMMPEMDGMEAARLIRASKHDDAAVIPIIAMTANAYDTDILNCMNAGMTEHMGKPIDPEQLHSLLSRVIG